MVIVRYILLVWVFMSFMYYFILVILVFSSGTFMFVFNISHEVYFKYLLWIELEFLNVIKINLILHFTLFCIESTEHMLDI